MIQKWKKRLHEREPAKPEEVGPNPQTVEKGKRIREEMDKVMEEIDNVLEENAEEFVKNYVQKSGE